MFIDLINRIFQDFYQTDEGGGGGDFNPGNPIDVDSDTDSDEDSSDDEFDEVIDDSSNKEEVVDEDEDSEDEDSEEEDSSDGKVSKKKENEKEAEDAEDDVDPDSPINTNIIKAISKKYPGLFKEFPEVKSAFFFGRQMRAVFPTIDDAKEAASVVQSFNFIQDEVSAGKPDTIVGFLKDDPDVLFAFAQGLQKNIAKINPELYGKLNVPIVTGLIKSMRSEAKLHNNENLAKVADWVAKFVFDTTELPKDPEVKLRDNRNPQAEAILKRQFGEFQSTVITTLSGDRDTHINNVLAKVKASPAVKKTLANEIKTSLATILQKDKAHMAYMGSLWDKAKREGFTRQSASRIQSAYLDAIKRALPGAREKALSEIGLTVKKVKKTRVDLKNTEKGSNSSKPVKKPGSGSGKDDIRGMTDLQYLEYLDKS